MSSTSALPPPPNPTTALAWLTPEQATQFEISRYVFAVTLGAYIWDVFINLPNDYKLLFRYKVALATVIYSIARVTTLAFIFVSFIFQVAPVEDCLSLLIADQICLVLSVSSTSFLFFLRLRAVYYQNKLIQAAFALSWLAVVAGFTMVTVGASAGHIGPLQAGHIGPSKQCIIKAVEKHTLAAAVLFFVHDTAVFLAVSYRILTCHVAERSFKARLRAFMGHSTSLPGLSRVLLNGGQCYYVAAVFGNIVLVVALGRKSLAASYCTIPIFALINLMACIAYRQVKFTYHAEVDRDDIHTTQGNLRFGRRRNDRCNDPRHTTRSASKPIQCEEPEILEIVIMKEPQTIHDSVH